MRFFPYTCAGSAGLGLAQQSAQRRRDLHFYCSRAIHLKACTQIMMRLSSLVAKGAAVLTPRIIVEELQLTKLC